MQIRNLQSSRSSAMLRCLLLSVLITLARGLPRGIIDSVIKKHGLTNVDITKIVEKSASNLDGRTITLEDVHDTIVNYNFLVEVSGPLTLTNGHLLNISSYTICDKIIRVDSYQYNIPLCFKLLEFAYQYDAEIGWFTHFGNVTGKIQDLEITLPVIFEYNQFTLNEIHPFNYGNIEIIFENSSFVTSVFNTLSSIFEDIIVHLLKERYARFLLMNVKTEMNKVLEGGAIKS